MKTFPFNFLILTVGLILISGACSPDKEDMTPDPNLISATIMAVNVGARAFIFTSIEGIGAQAELNAENATLQLKKGLRYKIINQGGDVHPFVIKGIANTILVSQNGTMGIFEADPQVNFTVEANEITFTLTDEMALQVAPYVCGRHAAMTGNINVVN